MAILSTHQREGLYVVGGGGVVATVIGSIIAAKASVAAGAVLITLGAVLLLVAATYYGMRLSATKRACVRISEELNLFVQNHPGKIVGFCAGDPINVKRLEDIFAPKPKNPGEKVVLPPQEIVLTVNRILDEERIPVEFDVPPEEVRSRRNSVELAPAAAPVAALPVQSMSEIFRPPKKVYNPKDDVAADVENTERLNGKLQLSDYADSDEESDAEDEPQAVPSSTRSQVLRSAGAGGSSNLLNLHHLIPTPVQVGAYVDHPSLKNAWKSKTSAPQIAESQALPAASTRG